MTDADMSSTGFEETSPDVLRPYSPTQPIHDTTPSARGATGGSSEFQADSPASPSLSPYSLWKLSRSNGIKNSNAAMSPGSGKQTIPDSLPPLEFVIPTVTDNGEKPDLTALQLIALAILHTPGRTATYQQICVWICNCAAYYCNEFLQSALTSWVEYNGPAAQWAYFSYRNVPRTLKEVRDVIMSVGEQYEPLIDLEKDTGGAGRDVFKIAAGKGRLIFESWNRDMSQPFKFMHLPTELRLMVYELVLSYCPGSKIELCCSGRGGGSARIRLPNDLIASKKPRMHALSILQVSKQVRTEALEKYYDCNDFSFQNMGTFVQFIGDLRPDSKEHISHLSLTYPRHATYTHHNNYFTKVLQLKHLTHLSITIYEDRHLEKYEDVYRFPGFKSLERLRGIEELNFEGNFTRTKRYLEPLLRLPRSKPRTKKGSKTGAKSVQKRNRKEDGEDGKSSKKRKTATGNQPSTRTRSASTKAGTLANTQVTNSKANGTATTGRKLRARKA